MKTRVRLKDVAEKVQLSNALVSGVLNKRPNVWASTETRLRIEEAAKELGYQPSAAAQALSKGRTDTVALVYRRLEGSSYRLAYSGLVDALSDDLQGKGYDLVVANFGSQSEVLAHLSKLAASRACDAVVLWGREEDTRPQAELLESLKVPFLVKGRHEVSHPTWNQIDFDHEGMIEQVVDHLVDLGHTRLAYLGFSHDEGFVHGLRRGFISAHERRLGSTPDPRFFAEHEDEVGPNEASIHQWLELPPSIRPTGFIIGAGNGAWQSLETCLAHSGHRLGFNEGDYAAAGITSLFFRLMFGEALAYQEIEIDHLARMAGPGILNAILKGERHAPVQRFLPKLSPVPSLHLLEHGVSFSQRRSD